MPALFGRGANTIYRAAIASVLACIMGAICVPMVWIRTAYGGDVGDPVTQPVAFDHRHHARDDGIDCVYCHETVETSAFAGYPSTTRCMGCHGQIWSDSPELAPVRESWASGRPIEWKRVTAVPDYVYFHHGVHVQNGIQCAQCHGRVEDMPRVERAFVMTMDFCLDCHRKHVGRAISRITTCSACHR
jgi:hypothetical protein